jgi:2-polyprenyl-6-methoxyphenol hydroxylase-like FAD-dependent oxidoreductase
MEDRVQCAIAGGGPAGMMLGVLLARAGVSVVVLEKHADFLRDFRGDTIHPSTLEIMYELGWLDEFLKLPHQKVEHLTGQVGVTPVAIADFTHLPVHSRFLALMPQWDFLNFLARKGKEYPGFRLEMQTEAIDLVQEGDRVTGVRARQRNGGGEKEYAADLVVAADGRGSVLRERAGLKVKDLGAPMDAIWFRLPWKEGDSDQTMGRFGAGYLLAMLNRGDYWQCAYVIRKGSFAGLKESGIERFRDLVRAAAPFEPERLDAIRTWDDVSLLTVRVDRLEQWSKPGFLAIGDAAHAMSPVGGVGVNLAVQDAVAAANILATPLRQHEVTDGALEAVERRRLWPTRVTQALQVAVQNRVIGPNLDSTAAPEPPALLRLMQRFPVLQRIPARIVGLGVRREHVAPVIRDGKG